MGKRSGRLITGSGVFGVAGYLEILLKVSKLPGSAAQVVVAGGIQNRLKEANLTETEVLVAEFVPRG